MTAPAGGDHIFHICSRAEADAALASGTYRAPSLESEGFIHLSQTHQVRRVADAFYAGKPDLVLLVVAPELLHATLRYEAPSTFSVVATGPVPDAAQQFPHLYGPLNADAIVEVRDLAPFLADLPA